MVISKGFSQIVWKAESNQFCSKKLLNFPWPHDLRESFKNHHKLAIWNWVWNWYGTGMELVWNWYGTGARQQPRRTRRALQPRLVRRSGRAERLGRSGWG